MRVVSSFEAVGLNVINLETSVDGEEKSRRIGPGRDSTFRSLEKGAPGKGAEPELPLR